MLRISFSHLKTNLHHLFSALIECSLDEQNEKHLADWERMNYDEYKRQKQEDDEGSVEYKVCDMDIFQSNRIDNSPDNVYILTHISPSFSDECIVYLYGMFLIGTL